MSERSSPWPWIPLKDLVAEMCLGKMLDKAKNKGTLKPYLGNINVRWFAFDLAELKEMPFEDDEVDRFGLRAGDLVVCEGGEPGRASVWNGQTGCMMIQKALHRIRFYPELYDPRFGMYFLFYGTTTNRFAEFYTGTTIKHLTGTALSDVMFPLAPLPEQHRIVAKIEELFSHLDAAVASLQRAKANLKRYRASVLKSAVEGRLTEDWRKEHPQAEDALGEIERTPAPDLPNRWSTRSKDIILGHGALAVGNPETAVPSSWTWTPLVRIARMETGHTPSRKHPEWWGGEVPWISISDARMHDGGEIFDTEEHTNADGLANSASRLLPKGTVCISRTASVGYVVVMGNDMATSQDFVNWVPTACVLSEWLRVVFMADRNALLRFGKGTVHKTIYFPEWLSTHIALPPLAEQQHIVALVEERLSQIDAAEKTIDAELVRAKRLRQSILKRAFEGKLVPQDPSDEPASVLLERIQLDRTKASRDGNRPTRPRRARRSP